jgi:hypothetical protein
MFAGRNRGCGSILAAGVGVLALVISVVWLALVWVRNGAVVADPRASVLGFVLAAAVAVAALVGGERRRRVAAGAPATAEQLRQAATTLAEVVAQQWAQEANARSLGDPEPMPVRWRLSASASGRPVMDHPEVIAASGLSFAGSSERIAGVAAAFRRLDRRRLVITGGPGTGKTTLAVQLLLELLAHPQPDEPVPVFFSLVGWNPKDQPRLQDWLTSRLERDYPALRGFGGDTARALVERGKILPILDGLDEVPAELRPVIITTLNRAAFPAPSGLILTSRRVEYAAAVTDAKDVLTAAAVIAPLALTRLDAVNYLRKLLPPDPGVAWSTVLGELESGAAADLAAVTANPLGLWLVRTVYLDGHRDPTPLVEEIHPDRSAHSTLRAHLLDQLIPAVLHSRSPVPFRQSVDAGAGLRPRHQHDPDHVRTWLTTLAQELRAAKTRDWLWWHLARHVFPTTLTAFTARLIVGGAVGLLVDLAMSLPFGLTIHFMDKTFVPRYLTIDLLDGLTSGGLPTGLVGGLVAGLGFGLTATPKHVNWRLRGRVSKLGRGLAFGLGVCLPIGLVFGLMSGLMVRLRDVWVYGGAELDFWLWPGLDGLTVGLVFGLAVGLIRFASSPSIAQRAISPTDSQRGDRQLTVLVTSTVGLAFGLLIGLSRVAFVLLIGLPVALVLGLASGLVAWLAAGLVVGLPGRAWPAFLIASGWLAVRRRLPWRLMAFLDDAYRLGLLRVVGSAYQFRHAELQDHLAP